MTLTIRFVHRFALAALLGLSVLSSPAPAFIVLDPSNLAQNALQAARSLQQINNQIHALQNQAEMIEMMLKNLNHLSFSSLPQITASLTRINQLMGQAQGIGFQIEQTQQRLTSLFPGSANLPGNLAAAQTAATRLAAVRSAVRDSMIVQSRVMTEASADTSLLADLVTQSQAADGGLAAQQATNQLLALVAKQQIALQAMQASQARADAMSNAMQIQEQTDAAQATRRFLGSGHAYTAQ